jgi:sugar transferase EpsL
MGDVHSEPSARAGGDSWYRRHGKRFFDLTIAVLVATALSPVIVLVSLAVLYNFGRPILFSQVRPGLRGIPFTIHKFRTMTNARDSSGSLLSDAVRLTRFGKFLRSSSLDELPELWNIVLGHMSLVGPRPLLTQYLPHYSAEQLRRHDVRPGLTGLAQVSGRNALTWDQKFAADVTYVDTHSFWLDMVIILKTIHKTIAREGINAPGEATMPYFKGSDVSAGHPTQTGFDEQ